MPVFITICYQKVQYGEVWETSNKAASFRTQAGLDTQVLSHWCSSLSKRSDG